MNLYHGDSLEILRTWPDNCIDSVVTDPPYGLKFMNKHWDYDVPTVELWREVLRVLKPGGHLLSFAGSRTYHRMAVNIEDAGFDIRDQIMWLHSMGFPKSQNVGKKLPEWDGWGTALKPAHEPIVVARKPLSEKTIAANVLQHGTGAINIDECRVGENPGYSYSANKNGTTFHGKQGERIKQSADKKGSDTIQSTKGRFPANVIHDGSDDVLRHLPITKSGKDVVRRKDAANAYHGGNTGAFAKDSEQVFYGDEGSAARFFYCAKVSTSERTHNKTIENKHPTVKPVALMKYLVKLVTQPAGLILDPFMGTGSTGACIQDGFKFYGIERDDDSFAVAQQRLAAFDIDEDAVNITKERLAKV